ncbi:sensor histidine kinase KdpD [Paenibacillus sp. NEAU-GSW1]|uniref:sensor histidine kinase n=1 Tax=Paenibacillus sp. NEAU-GSW1 TaxID=2682486 RepID=UPI001563EF48|nr:HAMP domain-containing sensor histidine kinase [Paenibacillus sp. NEAU-GSW1]
MKANIRLISRLAVHFMISLVLLSLLISFSISVMESLWPKEGDAQDVAILSGIAGVFVLFFIAYGLYIGRPIFYIVGKINRLADGLYSDAKASPYRKGGNKLKRPYRLYKELVEHLERLSETLEESKNERVRLDTMQKEWIAGISHDLKTPLTYIKGYSELLLAPQYDWSEEEKTRFLSEIQQKANHMEELIGDLNLSFRLEGQQFPVNLEKGDLVEYVRRVVADAANDPRAINHIVSFETDIAHIQSQMDVKLLQRALLNLMINAIVHNPSGTHLQVHIRKAAVVKIVIEDDGVGMNEETVARLFQKYYRGTTTERDSEGTGLGMAIANQIILAHNGHIEVKSVPQRGTIITISLHC